MCVWRCVERRRVGGRDERGGTLSRGVYGEEKWGGVRGQRSRGECGGRWWRAGTIRKTLVDRELWLHSKEASFTCATRCASFRSASSSISTMRSESDSICPGADDVSSSPHTKNGFQEVFFNLSLFQILSKNLHADGYDMP